MVFAKHPMRICLLTTLSKLAYLQLRGLEEAIGFCVSAFQATDVAGVLEVPGVFRFPF